MELPPKNYIIRVKNETAWLQRRIERVVTSLTPQNVMTFIAYQGKGNRGISVVLQNHEENTGEEITNRSARYYNNFQGFSRNV